MYVCAHKEEYMHINLLGESCKRNSDRVMVDKHESEKKL